MYLGADYYPEHWDKERWPKDAEMMAEAGLNVVRLAEFAWSRLEPQEGVFDFNWLDEVIEILSGKGISVVMCTPTATPPQWMYNLHPDILPVDRNRIRKNQGSRRHYCLNNPTYHDYTRRIVEKMAAHYSDNPAVIGWQIDNEFGCHNTTRCYCDYCLRAFQEWAKDKYGSLEALNKAWGTIFWSQVYMDWEEIPLPWSTPAALNPSLTLDFFRFSSDSNVRYQQLQIDILRRLAGDQFITHNLMGLFDEIDYFALARSLDFVAWDNYPGLNLSGEANSIRVSLSHDLMRGLKRSNFWVMEERSGQPGGDYIFPATRPGDIRLWTYQAIAHGADAVVYFRWRTCRFGAEEYWHGIIDHNGKENRRFEEVKRIGEEIKKVGEQIERSQIKAEVAILLSYDFRWAFKIQPHTPAFNYEQHLLNYYTSLHNANIPVDIISPREDLSQYKLVIAPTLFLLDDEIVANLYRYVENGGILVTTFRSGVKDWSNVVTEKDLPGELSKLFGIVVREYDPLPTGKTNTIRLIHPELEPWELEAKVWCDVISTQQAEVVAEYTQDYYAQSPAVTINQYGSGYAVYVGTIGEDKFYQTLLSWLSNKAGVRYLLRTQLGVEVTQRVKDDVALLFLLNHNQEARMVNIDGRYEDLLTGEKVEANVSLSPKGVRILRPIKE